MPTTTATVSIVIPVYNAERSLERCARSVLDQDFRDFQLLLVDDGSTDRSPAICDELAAQDPRVHVIHQANAGVSAARNAALDQARGEFVQFVDADDWLTPDATGKLVAAAREHDADLVIADFYRVVGDLVARKGSIDVDATLTPEQFGDCMLESPADFYYGVLWNKLFRLDVIQAHHLRMDPQISWCEDFVFNLEYVLHAHRIYPLREPVYYYVKTEGSLVAQGVSAAGIVRMKLAMIEYYDAFYRQLYHGDDESYDRRRPQIMRFLVQAAGDGGALPVLDGAQRLGEERGAVTVSQSLASNPLVAVAMAGRLARRHVEAIARLHHLDVRDVTAIALLAWDDGQDAVERLADLLDVAETSARVTLATLAARGYVEKVVDPDHRQAPALRPTDRARPVIDALSRASSQLADELAGVDYLEDEVDHRAVADGERTAIDFSAIDRNARRALGR
ncbi:glycosyltransferase [bacterium]|nr:glycosyltransferase [bacterium]